MDALARTTLALLVAAALFAAPAHAGSTPSPETAVAQLNAWRAQVGVDPVPHVPEYSEGCRLHANYWRLNHATGHFEDPSLPGYTAAGDAAASTSVLHYGPTSGPRDWEMAVYHRAGLLNPRLRATGYWGEFDLGCMNVLDTDSMHRTASLVAYSWPFDGQRDVPTTFTCNETPNPCTSVPGNPGDRPTGSIPSVQVNGPWAYFRVEVITASLVPDGGPALPLTVEDAGSPHGPYLDGGLALIPHAPLAGDRWYTASVAGSVVDLASGGEPRTAFSRVWRFRTAGSAEITPRGRRRTGLRVTGFRRRGDALVFTVDGGRANGRRASYSVTFGAPGRARVRHLTVRRRQRVRIPLSARAVRSGRATLHLRVRAFSRGRVRYAASSVRRTARW